MESEAIQSIQFEKSESKTKFKHKRATEKIAELPDIRNHEKLEHSLGVMIQDQSKRYLTTNSNIFGIVKPLVRNKFIKKINEDSEADQEDSDPSMAESNEKKMDSTRMTGEFQEIEKARKSPATQANFMSEPMQI